MSQHEECTAAAANADQSTTRRQQEQASTTHNDNDDSDNDEQQHEMKEWNLRFLFAEYKFGGPVWQGLQDSGWTHKATGGTYTSPDGQVFESGMEVCEYLDKFAIPPIQNTLQLAPCNHESMTLEEIEKGQELRKTVVRNVYKRMTVLSKRRGKQSDDDEEEESNEETDNEKEAAAAGRVKRRSSRLSTSSKTATRTETTQQQRSNSRNKSATAFEKGADTFLRRSRGGGTNKTVSSQDMAFLKFPSVAECVEQFRHVSSSQQQSSVEQEMEQQQDYKLQFEDWKFLLTTQNSLLLYGFGSKKRLLEMFASQTLEKEGDVLSIDGFDSHVRIESILDLLVNHFLNGNEPADQDKHGNVTSTTSTLSPQVGVTVPSMISTHEIVRRASRIARSLAVKQKEQKRPLFLVLHNIDGPSLRSRDVQEALAALVAHSTIESGVNAVRLIASIDHVNATALLWDNSTNANFSWLWKEVHTYRPYVEELAVGGMQDGGKKSRSKKRQADDMEDATLWNVLASLAPRHAEVVKILATLQSEDLKPVDHTALLRSCKHKMTVTNDDTLRQYLTELKDHGIVAMGLDPSTGNEWLRIPHSREKLLEIRDFEMEH